jgi:hypothetical protein
MIVGRVMKSEWKSMSIDELFALRELMQDVLSAKLRAKKAAFERQLQALDQLSRDAEPARPAVLAPPGYARN